MLLHLDHRLSDERGGLRAGRGGFGAFGLHARGARGRSRRGAPQHLRGAPAAGG